MNRATWGPLLWVVGAWSLAVGCAGRPNPSSETEDTATVGGGQATSEPSSDAASTAATAADSCTQIESAAACMDAGCLFEPGREVSVPDGECQFGDDVAGWCSVEGYGSTSAPGVVYEISTGRVFAMSNDPIGLREGWAKCECVDSEPVGCGCGPPCDMGMDETASGESSGAGSGSR